MNAKTKAAPASNGAQLSALIAELRHTVYSNERAARAAYSRAARLCRQRRESSSRLLPEPHFEGEATIAVELPRETCAKVRKLMDAKGISAGELLERALREFRVKGGAL